MRFAAYFILLLFLVLVFFCFCFFWLTGQPQVPMDIVTEATGVLASIRVTRYTTAKQVAVNIFSEKTLMF